MRAVEALAGRKAKVSPRRRRLPLRRRPGQAWSRRSRHQVARVRRAPAGPPHRAPRRLRLQLADRAR
eukprot:4834255-Alexandrium_andersonii.AAC.1